MQYILQFLNHQSFNSAFDFCVAGYYEKRNLKYAMNGDTLYIVFQPTIYPPP